MNISQKPDKSFKNASTIFEFRHCETHVDDNFCEKNFCFDNGTPKAS